METCRDEPPVCWRGPLGAVLVGRQDLEDDGAGAARVHLIGRDHLGTETGEGLGVEGHQAGDLLFRMA